MVKGTEMNGGVHLNHEFDGLSKQTIRFTARLFTKTFFQTTKTPKITFENNTWPHLEKAVLGKAVKGTRKRLLLFHGSKARRYKQNCVDNRV